MSRAGPSVLRVASLAFAAASIAPAAAHHSTAMFDDQNPIELSGTVREFQFENPHVFIILEVEGEAGERKVWSLEGLSPNVIYRQGWRPDSLRPGDRISVTVNPLHSGAAGGNYRMPRWEDGTLIDPRMPRPDEQGE